MTQDIATRAQPLAIEDVLPWLRARGVVLGDAQVEALGGGVSNDVFAVSLPDGSAVVVKQSCGRLRVADEWVATRERTLNEAAALRFVRDVTPDLVPKVLDLDVERVVLVIDHAPAGWRAWKEQLLAGVVDDSVAARLGSALAAWQAATAAPPRDPRLLDTQAFEELRIDPYHLTVAARHPDLGPALAPIVDRLRRDRRALVHGDFSPKNVLVGDDGLWVIDFEVVHYGDPAFDPAFLLSHLLLKTVARPTAAGRYAEAAGAFWATYRDDGGAEADFGAVATHTAALLLARVDGKSPAEYLTAKQRAHVRTASRRLLLAPAAGVAGLWEAIR